LSGFSQFINPARRSVPTPDHLIGPDGQSVFGTFESEFRSMGLVKTKKPTHAPQWLNSKKLTLWEACEVHVKEGILLTAVSDMGVFGLYMIQFWDRESNQIFYFSENVSGSGLCIAPNLLDGSVTSARKKQHFVKFANHFENGEAALFGRAENKTDSVEFEFRLKKIAEPSVVSIPFGENRPLYTEKEFFRAEGRLVLNGRVLTVDEDSTAVIDDHRGFYPRRMHYDWTATMGKCLIGGEKKYLSFNLTDNQSTDPEKYNENLIFLEGGNSLLPPVKFRRSVETKDFRGDSLWEIRDEHDMVHADFHVKAVHGMVVHAAVIAIDYYVVFGELSGYLRDENGNTIVLDGMQGIGEDKSMLF
jgi:hypothetical protein